jgi:sulfite reductase (ferredoxin)
MHTNAHPPSRQVWLGGSSNQTRLAEVFAERVKLANLEAFLEPLFAYWRASRRPGEGFGDFSARVGFAALREYSAAYVTTSAADALPKVGPGADAARVFSLPAATLFTLLEAPAAP